MPNDAEIVQRHVGALVQEAESAGIPLDVVGRLLVEEAIGLWSRSRGWQDIASELQSTAENLDPDADHEFMRP